MANWTRYNDTFNDGKAYGRGANTSMINLAHGGSNGWGADYPGYISNKPFVPTNLFIRLLAAPRGFMYLPEPDIWIQTLKSLFEVHPNSVTGFNNQLHVEMRESPFGGAGNVQEVVSNVTRARVQPVFNYVEKYNRPISTFFDRWAQELLMHEDSKYANVVHRVDRSNTNIDLLPDFTSATFLAFEADPTLTTVLQAWIVADVKPKDDLAPRESGRNIHQGGDVLEFPINTTGIAQTGPSVVEVARQHLLSMQFQSPMTRGAFTSDIDGNVLDATTGFEDQMKTFANGSLSGI